MAGIDDDLVPRKKVHPAGSRPCEAVERAARWSTASRSSRRRWWRRDRPADFMKPKDEALVDVVLAALVRVDGAVVEALVGDLRARRRPRPAEAADQDDRQRGTRVGAELSPFAIVPSTPRSSAKVAWLVVSNFGFFFRRHLFLAAPARAATSAGKGRCPSGWASLVLTLLALARLGRGTLEYNPARPSGVVRGWRAK